MKYTVMLTMLLGTFAFSQGYTYEVTVTNLTKSQIFSPPVAVSHNSNYQLFVLGTPSSDALSTMAEDGDNSLIIASAQGSDDVLDASSAGGPVMPGQSITFSVDGSFGYNMISVAGMLVSTNDAFFAIDSVRVSGALFKRGINYTSELAWAFDAGSELNTEDCAHISGPPCGNGGVRVESDSEGYVYVHAGITGDASIDRGDYNWNGPVARVSIRIVRN